MGHFSFDDALMHRVVHRSWGTAYEGHLQSKLVEAQANLVAGFGKHFLARVTDETGETGEGLKFSELRTPCVTGWLMSDTMLLPISPVPPFPLVVHRSHISPSHITVHGCSGTSAKGNIQQLSALHTCHQPYAISSSPQIPRFFSPERQDDFSKEKRYSLRRASAPQRHPSQKVSAGTRKGIHDFDTRYHTIAPISEASLV